MPTGHVQEDNQKHVIQMCVCVFNISHKNKDNKKKSSYIQIVYMVFLKILQT